MTHQIAATLSVLFLLGACASPADPEPTGAAAHELFAPYSNVWADLARREPAARTLTAALRERGCAGRGDARVTETPGAAAITVVELTFGCGAADSATLVAAYDSAGSIPALIDTYAVVHSLDAGRAHVLNGGDFDRDPCPTAPAIAQLKAPSARSAGDGRMCRNKRAWSSWLG